MLSPTKKTDRVKMINQIQLLAATLGAHCVITDESNNSLMKRAFHAAVHCANGLNASLTVDAAGRNTRKDVYVIAWYMDGKTTGRLSPDFESAIGQVNMYHRHKATSVAYGFDSVLKLLTVGITMAADRRAFMLDLVEAARTQGMEATAKLYDSAIDPNR